MNVTGAISDPADYTVWVNGVKARLDRKNLLVLSASARRPLWTGAKLNLLTGELWTEWELPPQMGPWTNIDPRQITIAGKALDTNGTAYFAWPDGVTRDVTPRTGYDYYTFAQPSVGKYTLVHRTLCQALTDTNWDRTTLGVGEYVFLSGMPENTTWEASGGGLSVTNGSATTFTAASNAASASVTAKVGGVSLKVPFTVLEPNGIDHAEIWYDCPMEYPNGYAGAGMKMHVFVAPTSVSFDRVCIMEIPGPATNITGYFATNLPPGHGTAQGAGHWAVVMNLMIWLLPPQLRRHGPREDSIGSFLRNGKFKGRRKRTILHNGQSRFAS